MVSPSLRRFSGVRVLVTGAGSGIGRAAATRFATEGADVVAADIDGAHLTATMSELRTGCAVIFDQSNETSVRELFTDIDRRGPLDVVCVNAGVALPPTPLWELDAAQWDRIHDVNLRGAFLIVREAVPRLQARGSGSFVFTSSTSGLVGHPRAGAYATTKSGLIGLSRTLALEVAPYGIRSNCVCPGGVDTPLIRKVVADGTDTAIAAAGKAIPLGRLATPDDIAAAIAFLASADAGHITATELVVDGGSSAATLRR